MRRIALLAPLLLTSCAVMATKIDRGPLPLIGGPKVSVEGRPLEYFVYGKGERTLLFLASIHGTEYAGTPLLHTLMRMLEDDPTLAPNARVVIVPVVNPDGVAAKTRRNARGIDLNRNFPADNYKQTTTHGPRPLSEPESSLVAELVQIATPELIVSIHQPADRVDYDGPAASIAYRMAAASPLEVRRMGARHGSLGSWGRDLGIAVVTLELPRDADELTEDELWETYGAMLLEALR